MSRPHPRLLAAVVAAALAAASAGALADGTISGTIASFAVAADGKSATATVDDEKSGRPVTVTITDDETLGKLKDKRLGEGDEVRGRYEMRDGTNVSRSLRKKAGC